MFKVECPGCSAPYQVDERRVPSTGLKMRCPKCGTSFQVSKPGESPEQPDNRQPSRAKAGVPRPRIGAGTMLGVAPVAKPPRPAGKNRVGAGTMIGVAAPPPPAAKLGSIGTSARKLGLKPTTSSTQTTQSKGAGSKGAGDSELPSVLGAPSVAPKGGAKPAGPPVGPPRHKPGRPKPPKPAPKAPSLELDLPGSSGAEPLSVAPESLDLSEPVSDEKLESIPSLSLPPSLGGAPSPSHALSPGGAMDFKDSQEGLPVLAESKDEAGFTGIDFKDSQEGLPVLAESKDEAGLTGMDFKDSQEGLPVVAQPGRSGAMDFKDSQEGLPVVAQARSRLGMVNLKDSQEGLPVLKDSLPPDSLPAITEDDLDLPDTAGDSLPSLSPPAPESLPAVMLDDSKLSSNAGDSLPAIISGDDQLPELTRMDSELPSVADVERSLPSIAPRDMELPSPKASNLDTLGLDGGAFGEVELPMVGSGGLDDDEGAPQSLRAGGPASLAATAVEPLGTARDQDDVLSGMANFELPDLDAPGPTSMGPNSLGPMAPPSGSPGEFGDFGTAPVASTTQPEAGLDSDFDFGAPPSAADPFGGAALDAPSGRPSAADFGPDPFDDIDDDRGGGAGYGEVDLGGDDAPAMSGIDTDAGMEFGAIPQEEEDAAAAPSSADVSSLENSMPAASASVDVARAPAAKQPAKAKRTFLKVLGGFLLLGIAGGALALLPRVGPFGVYFIMDTLHADQHAALLQRTADALLAKRKLDSYQAAKQSIGDVAVAQSQAIRYRPLQAYEAFAGYSLVLRFGAEPTEQSKASVIMQELDAAELKNDVVQYALASAARSAVSGKLAVAKKQLTRLRGSQPKSLEVLSTLGEVELRAGDTKAASEVWGEAAKLYPSAWTLFGLARSQQKAGLLDQADKTAQQVLKANPKHHGAALLLAELRWSERKENEAVKYIDGVLEQQKSASQAEIIRAHTLLGELHLDRGRVSKAEGEFNLALQIDPKVFRALCGLGDTYYQGGRFAAALARYEAALASRPGALVAELGVAKSQIALERVELALPKLAELYKTHPKDARVAYWFGKAHALTGDRTKAEAAFKAAIDIGGDAPEVVKAYIDLAGLHSKAGQLDEANQLLLDAQKKLPKSALLKKALGDVALSQARYEDALAAFEAAKQLDPEDLGARFKIGSTLRRLKRFDEAWAVFEDVAKRDKDLPGLPLERGLLLEQSGRGDEALKEYENALKAAPEDLDLMLRVGCGRVAAGYGKAAEEVLKVVLKKRPKSAEVNHCIGRAAWLQGSKLRGLKYLQRAVELDSNRAEYHMYVGWVANDLGQPAIAETALEQALELDKGLADAYWQRGILRLRRGAALDAVADLTTALKLKPSRYEAHAELAQAYYQIGKEGLALNEWQQAIAADGNNPLWLFRYGKLLYAKRRNAEAAKHLGKAIELLEQAKEEPAWLWQAYHLLAASLPPGPRANGYWKKFLELGPEDSPYRTDAERALGK